MEHKEQPSPSSQPIGTDPFCLLSQRESEASRSDAGEPSVLENGAEVDATMSTGSGVWGDPRFRLWVGTSLAQVIERLANSDLVKEEPDDSDR